MRKIIPFALIILFVIIAGFVIIRPDKKSTFVQLTMQGSCPGPFIFQMPVDLSKVTSTLYPGQYRGGDYKPHGGFRFDNSRPNEITVIVPYDAEVVAGSRYPVNGEIQYTFDFAHPCGIRYRFGHLLTLAPKFQAIAEKFPMPEELDSRTTEVRPGVKVKQGEIIATAVGLTRGGPSALGGLNTFVDWGVYDYRQKTTHQKMLPGQQSINTRLNIMRFVCGTGCLRKIEKKCYLYPPQIPKAVKQVTTVNKTNCSA